MRKNSASAGALFLLIIPIFSMTSTTFLLGEQFGTLRIVGAGLVLVGLAVCNIRLVDRPLRTT